MRNVCIWNPIEQVKDFDSDEAVPHSGDPHRPHQRLLKKQNAPGGGYLRFDS